MSMSVKTYKCSKCGHESQQNTNHYGQTYSWGRVNICPVCPPHARPTTWECQDTPPAPKTFKSQAARDAQAAGYGKPSYWDYLDQHAEELAVKGVENALTRSLSEALAGNDGI